MTAHISRYIWSSVGPVLILNPNSLPKSPAMRLSQLLAFVFPVIALAAPIAAPEPDLADADLIGVGAFDVPSTARC